VLTGYVVQTAVLAAGVALWDEPVPPGLFGENLRKRV